jgi:P27 family predicted phage terminase small subunit
MPNEQSQLHDIIELTRSLSRKPGKELSGMQPPKRLKNEARKKWVEVFKDLKPDSPLDIEAACQYCEAWADYIRAREVVAEMGMVLAAGKNGAPYQNPAIGTQNKALDTMRRMYALLKSKVKPTESDELSLD